MNLNSICALFCGAVEWVAKPGVGNFECGKREEKEHQEHATEVRHDNK